MSSRTGEGDDMTDFLTRLAQVVAARAIQREIDNQPCVTCGGDPLRPAYDGRTECHAPWPEREPSDAEEAS